MTVLDRLDARLEEALPEEEAAVLEAVKRLAERMADHTRSRSRRNSGLRRMRRKERRLQGATDGVSRRLGRKRLRNSGNELERREQKPGGGEDSSIGPALARLYALEHPRFHHRQVRLHRRKVRFRRHIGTIRKGGSRSTAGCLSGSCGNGLGVLAVHARIFHTLRCGQCVECDNRPGHRSGGGDRKSMLAPAGA